MTEVIRQSRDHTEIEEFIKNLAELKNKLSSTYDGSLQLGFYGAYDELAMPNVFYGISNSVVVAKRFRIFPIRILRNLLLVNPGFYFPRKERRIECYILVPDISYLVVEQMEKYARLFDIPHLFIYD